MPKGVEKRKAKSVTPKKKNGRSESAKRSKFVRERSVTRRGTRSNSAEVNFQEGDQLIDISVSGQYSEYATENCDSGEEGEILDEQEDMDTEVTFNIRADDQNNNATGTVEVPQIQGKNHQEMDKRMSINEVREMIQESQKQTANLLQKQFQELQREQVNFMQQQQKQIQVLSQEDGDTRSKERPRSSTKSANGACASFEQPKRTDKSPQRNIADRKGRQQLQGNGCQETRDVVDNNMDCDESVDKRSPGSSSDVTVYTNAVKNGIVNTEKQILQVSSDDDQLVEMVDTSDEFQNENNMSIEQIQHQAILDFITATRSENRPPQGNSGRIIVDDGMKPSTSRQEPSAKQRGDQLIKDAEVAKAKIYDVPGRIDSNIFCDKDNLTSQFMKSALMDESFLLVASHLDQNTHEKIIRGEYVDFARLIPRDRILTEEDQRMQLVMKGNESYWIPANQTENTSINSFSRWEQAFRVFSDVYTRAHPSRASELVQYNHVIHTAAMAYSWDNVYLYDKDFRLHLARNPERSWALLLQQSWSLRLKDKIRHEAFQGVNSHNEVDNRKQGCRRFNKGRCTYGGTCRYEHKCFYCNKMGHGVVVCRQLMNDKGDRNGGNHNHGNNYQSHGNNNQGQRRTQPQQYHQQQQPQQQFHYNNHQANNNKPASQINNSVDKKINNVK